MKKQIVYLLVLILSLSSVFANLNETGTGLDYMLDLIQNDPGLIANVPNAEILEAMYAGNEMNIIILESIIKTNIAIDNNFSTEDMKTLNSYINTNYFESWTLYHGDDEDDEETGYHLVQNDGATTQIFGKNAINTVIDGIYHLGFPAANENQVQNEDGNANAKYSDLALWLNSFLANDLENTTSLIGNLKDADVTINMDNNINGDDIKFTLSVENEIFDLRKVSIKPSLICNGTENKLYNNNGYLTSSLLSSQNKDLTSFTFKLNKGDFSLRIPTNTNCLFLVHLEDEYRTDLYLIKDIIFNKKEESKDIPSISGSSIDIVSYMNSVVLNGVNTGYNNIAFTVQNNENVSKQFTINLVVNNLGVAETSRISLKPESKRDVSIPLYIKENTKKGLYPIRISVSNEDDKKVKYTFVKVN